VMYKDDDSDV